jgi:hypothetical protein
MNPDVRDKVRQILTAPFAGVGASETAMNTLMAELGHRFPEDYLQFMRQTNGYNGEVGPNGFVSIWPVEDVMPTNQANRFREWIPGLVLFASNESGDFYAFDMRQGVPTVVFVPSIPLRLDSAVEFSPSFVGFLERLAESS